MSSGAAAGLAATDCRPQLGPGQYVGMPTRAELAALVNQGGRSRSRDVAMIAVYNIVGAAVSDPE